MAEEDRIVLTSVGVDIGSSTSHLLFSRLELERQDTRYVTVKRDVLYQSDILLTPYHGATTIDQSALGEFIDRQYHAAGLDRQSVDTGALILTGVALLRENSRAIAELFAEEAGRFVAVSAGDNLEATMAAYGSGAIAFSESQNGGVMNVDIGGGTTKVVICRNGRATELMAIDVGARLIAFDERGVVTRLEPAALDIGKRLGLSLSIGQPVTTEGLRQVVRYMVDHLMKEVAVGGTTVHSHLLRTGPLRERHNIAAVTFSGGVSEYVYGRAKESYGDLGPLFAEELAKRNVGAPIAETPGGIRATVIGASQYTIQVSGSTIYLSPPDVVPIRNIPVVIPPFAWHDEDEDFSANHVTDVIRDALRRFDLVDGRGPVALAAAWQGSATYKRIKAFCSGAVEAMRPHLARGQPLILVFDSDIGGLLGLHIREEMQLTLPIISIDGVELREFDYIDIGALIPSSGAVPVVIKSLVFPSQ